LSIRFGMRGGIASVAVAVAAALALAPAAVAATHAPAGAKPALKTSGKSIRLGKASSVSAITEAPNGDVLFAVGKDIYGVVGGKTEELLAASGPVLALAATNDALFVQNGLKVTEYEADNVVGHWTLYSPVRPITSAGLYVAGKTVWSWTDWSTDESGFEFATVSKFSTSSSKVTAVSKSDAQPADMAADSAGLYYEIINVKSGKSYLVLTTPSGKTTHKVSTVSTGPVALAGGRVDALAFHYYAYIDSYSASTLGSAKAVRLPGPADVAGEYRDIAGTSAGLLLFHCSTASCTKASVGVLNASNGKVTGSVSLTGAYTLLDGPAPYVLTDVSGIAYLVKLAS
jgi:hypothetical protein